MLRDYQQRTIDDLYRWLETHAGHPCLVLPTGSGKSHIIAAICKDAVQTWPDTRILMLTHVKELIEQNTQKVRQHWPNAPIGIYSASVGKKQLGEPITFAGIQSVRNRARDLGHIDLCIIDECHLVSHKDEGSYRKLISELLAINSNMRVIGLTATPYRLGHGLITDKPALFDDLIEPVSIKELVDGGYLAPLRSKVTDHKLDVNGVHKRGGEFIESELQAVVDTDANNKRVVDEIMLRAGDRRAWLIFCAGVQHARHVRDLLCARGVAAEAVTGDMPKAERERIIDAFKAGRLRALTNANILTTGFDYPDIDLIAMLRPTMSPALYVQMAGRGMRVKSHTDHCLVLDFAGNVQRHGPITCVQPPRRRGKGGDAPVKTCPECREIVHASVKVCPACGMPFKPPRKEKAPLELHGEVDIMGIEPQEMHVRSWRWRVHISRTSGKLMLACTYYGGLSDPAITEYLPVLHDGYARQKALRLLFDIASSAGISLAGVTSVSDEHALSAVAARLNAAQPPERIVYRMDGRFYRVLERRWPSSADWRWWAGAQVVQKYHEKIA